MFHKLGTLSDAANEATAMESPCKQGELFGTIGKVSTEKGKKSYGVSALSGTASGVSAKEGEAIPSQGGEAVDDGKGLRKTW